VRRTLLASALAVGLLLAACGSNDSPTTAGSSTTKPVGPCSGKVDGVKVSGAKGAQPKVTFDKPLKTSTTRCQVLIAGSGRAAKDGDAIVFGFTFINGRDASVYGSSYAAAPTNPSAEKAASIVLNDQLIRGVRQGLLGAKAGSRVLVEIAPKDAYGPKGGDTASGLKKDDTLLFVADIIEVRDILARAEGDAVAPVAGLPKVALDGKGQPTITVPKTDPPSTLVIQPLIQGKGDVVKAGQTITVNYTGILWGSGQQFDSSWGRTPTNFVIGTSAVIPGWDKGLVGRKVGSQILLVIPPADGYGPAGQASAGISGTDTLVFVVDILDVRDTH
jgi:peptidylprolyl isomerase